MMESITSASAMIHEISEQKGKQSAATIRQRLLSQPYNWRKKSKPEREPAGRTRTNLMLGKIK